MQGAALAELAVRRWGRAPRLCKCAEMGRECILRPRPIQGFALNEISRAQGLVGGIPVGLGKTFVDIMSAMAMPDCKVAMLLVPSGLRDQLKREYELVREHWDVPTMIDAREDGKGGWKSIETGRPVVRVVAYSTFSQKTSTALIRQISPDTVIADEGQSLRDPDAARTGRLLAYWLVARGTRLVTYSGTLFDDSLLDACHLFALALGANSPLPLDKAVATEWALATDPGPYPAPAGALEAFGSEDAREGLRRRMVETVGVVSTSEPSIDIPLHLSIRTPPPMPVSVAEALEGVRSGKRPDGQWLVEDMEVAAYALQVSCGFFYRWRFPDVEPGPEGDALIKRWFAARKEWGQDIRDRLSRRKEHLDSPSLCEDAAKRAWGDAPKVEGLPEWKSPAWPTWRDVRGLVIPVRGDAVWIDPWLAQDAAAWGRERKGIVWYAHTAFGAKVAESLGVPLQGGGPEADARIRRETGTRSIVASINAHGVGRDGLQDHFSEGLVTAFPSSGKRVEQLFGRVHRVRQKAKEVRFERYAHTPEVRACFDKAYDKAGFISGIFHGDQKILRSARAEEKELSRREDARALESGEKSREQLRAENGAFAFPREMVRIDFSRSKHRGLR